MAKPNNYMTPEELDALHLKARRRRLEKDMHDNRYIEGLRSLIEMQQDHIKELEDRPMHKEIRELQARIRELERIAAEKVVARAQERDRLHERIRELEAENMRLDGEWMRCKHWRASKLDPTNARIKELEAERDMWQQSSGENYVRAVEAEMHLDDVERECYMLLQNAQP